MSYITFQPKDYFNSKLYSGNGGTQTISGIGFQPDWVWFKTRSATSHMLQDAVRGTTKFIESNTTTGDQTSSDGISSFNSDGYAIGDNGRLNSNGTSMVSWNWKANGQGSSNTDGSINTTYTSANTTSGFSISTYTGTGSNATVGHGLGVAPKCFILKKTSDTSAWSMYHESVGNTKFLTLNGTGAATTGATVWNNTSPTSSVFSVGTGDNGNASGATYVAYCFAEKKGFSKFGSYFGNGNADGAFVYTGFKPAMVLFKQSSASGEKWYIYDNKRNAFNITNSVLFPNASDAESSATTGAPIDMLSNGFKLKGTDAAGNGSGSTYIYMAFAEEPLVSSNNIPATAR